jgi:hypothetical protein
MFFHDRRPVKVAQPNAHVGVLLAGCGSRATMRPKALQRLDFQRRLTTLGDSQFPDCYATRRVGVCLPLINREQPSPLNYKGRASPGNYVV